MFDMIDLVRHRTQTLQEVARRIREERDLRAAAAAAAATFETAPVADDPQPVRPDVVPCPECPSGTTPRSRAA